jgi:hypothetical protein
MAATGYIGPQGADIRTLFAPLNGGTPAAATSYLVGPQGWDLNTLFYPYQPGSISAAVTNYKVNGTDLNSFFQNINYPVFPYSVTGGSCYTRWTY